MAHGVVRFDWSHHGALSAAQIRLHEVR